MKTGGLLDANYRDVAARLLWLSRARAPDGALPDDWEAMYVIGGHERLLGLAWHNGGDSIRTLAPPHIVAAWRSVVVHSALRAEAQIGAVAEFVAECRDAGIQAVVLKGAPLAHRLYGDHRLRPSLDADLFIPAPQRPQARRVLEQLGWEHIAGAAPREESFQRKGDDHHLLMEVQSRLLDDPVLEHLELPGPDHVVVPIEGVQLPAHDGALMPGFLAAHLAKHDQAPLLWLNDFSLLWTSLAATQRAAAVEAAAGRGLGRHLDWAIARASRLEAAAAGDASALERLGYGARRRTEVHTLLRLTMLSSSPAMAARVILGRLWPPHLREDGRGFVRQAAERLAGRLERRHGGGSPVTERVPVGGRASEGRRHSGRAVDAPAARALDVGRDDFRSLIADLLNAGDGTWIRARGESMEPTIPNGALVHIIRLPERSVQCGEVVLAAMPDGSFALHRVIGASAGVLTLQGDAVRCADSPIPRERVLAVADLLEHGGRRRPIPGAPGRLRRHLSSLVRRCRRALRRLQASVPGADARRLRRT